jgi:succinate dehydrogenase / fumarate reductase cytochrome b subunit
MNRITTFIKSSVGRKLLMGLTGFFLGSFLVVHLFLNLFLFKSDGGSTYDAYSEFMATYPLEIVLFAGFLLHMILGVWLWWTNRNVRDHRYAVNRASESSALSSRIMFVTGAIIMGFLVVHINTFFVQSRFFPHGITMYEMVAEAFANPWYDALYLVAIVFLAYHLRHGVQSAFQTFGLRTPRYRNLIDWAAVVFWLLIPAAFASIPIYFLWAHLTGSH